MLSTSRRVIAEASGQRVSRHIHSFHISSVPDTIISVSQQERVRVGGLTGCLWRLS